MAEKHAIRIKRVYDPPAAGDGTRVLIDRLWPRGLSKEKVAVDHWLRDLAPSDALRHWFGHDPARWPEFHTRYEAELAAAAPDSLDELVALCRKGPVTLVYAARDTEHNNAVALKAVLGGRLKKKRN